MSLIRQLDQADRLDIFETSLRLPALGRLKDVRRRQAFDVEAAFIERRLLIETKVDSDEGGRWAAATDYPAWQSNKIAACAKEGDVCLFITYGFSEFFTKWFDFGPAAPASRVRHVGLDPMVALLEEAEPILCDPGLSAWLTALRSEQRKRLELPAVLSAFANFRRTYLHIAGEVDFTIGRIGFNGPEIAFPAFAQLLEQWRNSPYCQRYGRLALYPVGRLMLPVDSILNWWELWQDGEALTLGGLLPASERALYLEVNEDFNLHLKLDFKAAEYIGSVREEVSERLASSCIPSTVVACRPEFHTQGALAVWEWDFDLPTLLSKNGGMAAVSAVGTLLDDVVPRLT
ncbi:MAG: hypothetical protein M3Y41_06395 [Pseudomonadota bacterium]|nr:hypothetical protein [Pseudomonadota bacterium]